MVQQTVFAFKLEKTSENLTAHGGLSLLSEFNQQLGLTSLVDAYLPAPGSNRGYGPSVFANAVVMMLQGGGHHLEDLRELQREQSLLGLLNQRALPDPDTVGDWLRRMGDPSTGASGLLGLERVRTRLNHRVLSLQSRSDYTLDVDATQIESWKRDAAFTYQGVKGYMPLLGYLCETGLCVYDEFREGNVSPSDGQAGFYESCKARMPLGQRIARYRADSASYGSSLINRLDSDGVFWTITAPQDRAVRAAIASIPESCWQEPQSGCGYELAETVHSMEKTSQAFRLIVKRERRVQGALFGEQAGSYFHYAVGTNWPAQEKNSVDVLRWHNARGEAENFHKELKIGFGMQQMPCGEGWANAVYFRLGVIAYNLFIGFKHLSGPAAWVRHTIATFRWKLIQTAGRIVRHAGQVFLKLAVDAERLRLFHGIRQRTYALGRQPGG